MARCYPDQHSHALRLHRQFVIANRITPSLGAPGRRSTPTSRGVRAEEGLVRLESASGMCTLACKLGPRLLISPHLPVRFGAFLV